MLRRIALCCALLGSFATPAVAVTVPTGFADEVQIFPLSDPASLAFLPDGRVVLVERITANVKLWTGSGLATTLTTIPNVRTRDESGLLGIAVDPGWPAKPYVYVHYNHYAYPDSDVRIVRLTCEGDLGFSGDGSLTIDFASHHDVLTGNRDVFTTHNGGTLRFGPDGMLYASFGDDYHQCAAQDTANLNGKILRLDVSQVPAGPGGPPNVSLITPVDNPFVADPRPKARLVYALGLRNPFRFHIDPATGDVFIADVGLDDYEEIDHVPSGMGGLNFGWPWREAFHIMGSCNGSGAGLTDPMWFYAHDSGLAVISAGLYRRNGGAFQFPPGYEGNYFFHDYYFGDLYRLERFGNAWQIGPPVPGQPNGQAWGTGFWFSADWTVGPDGAMWWMDRSSVHRLSFTVPAAVDPVIVPPSREDRAFYDLQGRRVQDPKRNGLYFTRTGKKRVVLN